MAKSIIGLIKEFGTKQERTYKKGSILQQRRKSKRKKWYW